MKQTAKVHPKLIKQYLNSSAYFTCASAYKPRWFFNRKTIPFPNVVQDSKDNLVITMSTLKNGGEYYCYGYNDITSQYFLSRVFYISIGKYEIVLSE